MVVAAALLAIALSFTLRSHDRGAPAARQGGPRVNVAASSSRGVASGSDGSPLWLGQRGLPARRIAGQVLGASGGLAAVVRLLATPVAGPPAWDRTLSTDAGGRFDLGLQPAHAYTLVAMAPGYQSASRQIDLRQPNPRPPHDELVIKLRPCAAEIGGRLVDADATPIATGRIFAEAGLGDSATTDARGEYRLCIVPGEVQLLASAPGYGSVVHTFMATAASRHDITLVPAAVVSGRVVVAGGDAGVGGALVRAQAKARGARISAPHLVITDATGAFEIQGLSPGQYRLDGQAEGYVSRTALDFTVNAADRLAGLRCALSAATGLSGVVVRGGAPVVGAVVSALDTTTMMRRTAVTQAEGGFHVDRITLGTLKMAVEGYRLVGSEIVTVSRPDPEPVRLEVAALGAIHGRVLRDGAPVALAKVTAQGEAQPERGTTADAGGNYAFEGLPTDTYNLIALDGKDDARGSLEGLSVKEGAALEGRDIDISQSSSIAGRVIDEANEPVAAVIVLMSRSDGHERGSCVTTAGGEFTVSGLRGGGEYRPDVWESSSGAEKLPPAGGRFPPVTLGKAGGVSGVQLVVTRRDLQIAGTVVDEGGGEVSDVRVDAVRTEPNAEPQFYGWADLKSSVTNGDGRFLFRGLHAGSYALKASTDAGRQGLARNVAAGSTDAVIKLQGTGSIEGELRGFRATPTVYASVFGTMPATQIPASVRGNGFTIGKLGAGKYRVAAVAPEGGDLADVEVKTSSITHVVLQGRGSAKVAGRVTELRSKRPVSGMWCLAALRSGKERTEQMVPGTAVSGADGQFELSIVPASSLAIECMTQSGSTTYSDGVAFLTPKEGEDANVEVVVVKKTQPASVDFGLRFDMSTDALRVASARPGGAGARAGVQTGDVIVAVDGQPLDGLTLSGSVILLLDRAPGTPAQIVVLRGGEEKPLTLVSGDP